MGTLIFWVILDYKFFTLYLFEEEELINNYVIL